MIEKIKNLYSANKYALWWTVWYIFGTYIILKYLFNFSIFSATQWHKLMYAHLYGFAGFVFGILILAAVPLYVATTTIVIRTKKPLLTIPLPKIPACVKHIVTLFHQPAPEPAPAPAPTPEPEQPQSDHIDLPADMPAEMRASYVRARKYGSSFAIAQHNLNHINESTTAPTDAAKPGELPIPTDFDFDVPDTPADDTPVFSDVPMFTDIDFDAPNTATTDNYNDAVLKRLAATGRETTVINDIVIADGMAIASHTDDDFWIADAETWFAPGKTRPSPIAALTRVATENNAKPILYLGATNIMDLDTLRPTWESAGITVITKLSEI